MSGEGRRGREDGRWKKVGQQQPKTGRTEASGLLDGSFIEPGFSASSADRAVYSPVTIKSLGDR